MGDGARLIQTPSETPEEARWQPRWPRRCIGDAQRHVGDIVVQFDRFVLFDGLAQVVRRRVVARRAPLLLDHFLWSALCETELEGNGGDARANEAILVGTD